MFLTFPTYFPLPDNSKKTVEFVKRFFLTNNKDSDRYIDTYIDIFI